MCTDLSEDDGRYLESEDASMVAELQLMEEISLLAADAARTFKGKYSDKAIQSLLLAGKYISISSMSPCSREYFVERATGYHRCPMCVFYYLESENCEDCPMSDGEIDSCGATYQKLLYAMINGSQVDVLINLSIFLDRIM